VINRYNPSKYAQKPLGPQVDYLEALIRVVDRVDLDLDFPDYCFDDPIFSDPHYPVAIRCESDDENREPFHVVLISSFDGISWWCWIVEDQKFEIMEFTYDES